MSQVSQTSVDRVLANEYLYDQILSRLPKADSARCARVCRRWQEIALDHVWRDMDSLVPLLKLLASPGLSINVFVPNQRVLYFPRGLRGKDWKSFMPYAERVKSMELLWSTANPMLLSDSIFMELARSRTTLSILPNLSVLKMGNFTDPSIWSNESRLMNYVGLFLHQGVKTLEFGIDIDDRLWTMFLHDRINTFFDEISDRAPRLTTLTIDIGSSERVCALLSRFFSGLTYLEILRVNSRAFIPVLVTRSLAHLPNLRKVQILGGVSGFLEGPFEDFKALERESAFPQLRCLSIRGHFESLVCLLSSRNAFRNLVELDIYDGRTNNLNGLLFLLRILSIYIPFLRRLAIKDNRTTISDHDAESYANSYITQEVFSPLIKFSRMEVFEYNLVYPIGLTHSQLAAVLGNWTSLRTLIIKPILPNPSTLLTLSVLPLLSESFPLLSDLGLCINATVVPDDLGPFPDRRFRRLTTLDLGASPVSNAKAVALYLSRIIPSQCILVDNASGDAPTNDYARRAEKWKEVGEWLPFLARSYEDSLKAFRSLQGMLDVSNACLLASERLLRERDEQIRLLQEASQANVNDLMADAQSESGCTSDSSRSSSEGCVEE